MMQGRKMDMDMVAVVMITINEDDTDDDEGNEMVSSLCFIQYR